MTRRSVVAASLFAAAVSAAKAAEIPVKTLSGGPGGTTVVDPAVLNIQPRDTILVMPVDRGRNAESISGTAPEAAAPFTTEVGMEGTVAFVKLRSLASGARRTTSWGGSG
jgi:hypothetical protein